VSLPFYDTHFGFKLLHIHTNSATTAAAEEAAAIATTSFYMAILSPERLAQWPAPGCKEAEQALLSLHYGESCLKLSHTAGSEGDASFAINSGNVEPHRGFGHIAVMTPDVYAASEELEAAGVKFQKRPNEGRMKGLAFALDPDGYWVEIVSRHPTDSAVAPALKYSFAQTMLRVRDAAKSVAFYCDKLGMTNVREIHFPQEQGGFSLYFLVQLKPGQKVPASTAGEESGEYIRKMMPQVLELTHNHGTELADSCFPGYHDGNDEDLAVDPPMLRGFGHVGFLCNDVKAAAAQLSASGVDVVTAPGADTDTTALLRDPDGYHIELIQAGSDADTDAADDADY